MLKDTARAFKSDFRLIKPKKFGYKAKNNDETELVEIKRDNQDTAPIRKSVTCNVRINKSISESLENNYLAWNNIVAVIDI